MIGVCMSKGLNGLTSEMRQIFGSVFVKLCLLIRWDLDSIPVLLGAKNALQKRVAENLDVGDKPCMELWAYSITRRSLSAGVQKPIHFDKRQ